MPETANNSAFKSLIKKLCGNNVLKTEAKVLALEKIYCTHFPESLRDLLSAIIASKKGIDFFEWRFHADEILDYDELKKNGKNLFEELVLLDQENYLGTWMADIFSQVIYIGSQGNGDGYYANVNYIDDPKSNPANAEVLHFDHEEAYFDSTFAYSIENLAEVIDLFEGYRSEEKTDTEKMKERMLTLKDKVNLSWHFDDLVKATDIKPVYEIKSDPMNRVLWNFYRSLWIQYILRNDGVHTLTDSLEVLKNVREKTEKLSHSSVKDYLIPLVRKGEKMNDPMKGIYWVWHTYFTEPEYLEEVCDYFKSSSSSVMLADAISLVLSFHKGERKKLGKIEDLPALQKKFIDALSKDTSKVPEGEQR